MRTVLISINDEYTVEMDFNTQNYLERIPALQGILKQTENFLKEIPFPINDSVTRKILKSEIPASSF